VQISIAVARLGLGAWSNALTAIFANNFQLITAVVFLTSSIVQFGKKCVNLQITAEARDVAERWS
jgi:hypothetical protein